MDAEISAVSLHELSRALLPQPQIVDVRGEDTFARDRRMIPGAVRRSPDIAQWQSALEPWRAVVVHCDRGHEASRNAADHAMLRFGMLVYDALYAWCREAAREAHGWNPAALRQAMASSAREA